MKEVRRFFGGMDLDRDADHLQDGDYREAWNCIDTRGNFSRGLIFNLPGTVKKAYSFTGAQGETWTAIGSALDILTHKLYYFVYGSATNHYIIEFDLVAETSASIYKHALLNFSLSYPVQAEVRDGVLIWTDDNNPPRHLDITRAKNFTAGSGTPIYAAIDAQVLDCVWYPPAYAPTVAYGTDTSRKINNLIKKNFQFAYRYVYFDHGKSVVGPYSYIPLPVNDELSNGLFNESVNYQNNYIDVTINEGHATVSKIEILVREPRVGEDVGYWRLAYTIDKSNALSYASPNSYSSPNYVYRFTNDRGTEIDIDDSLRPYDYVPLKAKTLAFVEQNRLVFGNYTRGYANIIPDVTLSYSFFAFTANLSSETPFAIAMTQIRNMIAIEFADPTWIPEIKTITFPTAVSVGNVYTLVFYDIVNHVYTVTPTAGYTNIQIATAFKGQITAHYSCDIDATTGVLILTGNESSFYYAGPVTITGSVSVAASGYVPRSNGWKRGSVHPLGMIYRDAQGRAGGVITGPSMSIYIKSPSEQLAGGAFVDETSASITTPNYSTRINFKIDHLPPSWATTYQFVYFKNSLSFYQQYQIYSIGTAQTTGAKPQIAIDVNTYIDTELNRSSKSLVPLYEFTQGDRIRFIAKFSGGAFALFSSYVDMAINGLDPTTGAILVDNFDYSTPVIGTDTIVEVYRPDYDVFTKNDNTVVADYSEQIKNHYFEVGPVFPVTGGYHLVTGCAGGTNQDSTHDALGFLDKGDSYIRTRMISGQAFPVESDSISDYFQSAVMHKGRIAIMIPEAAQTKYINGITYGGINSNSYDELNYMFSFNYDGYTNELPERYGYIAKLVCLGDILKVIQQNKVSSIYIGRDAASTIEGSDIIRTTDAVMGSIRPSVDDYGTIFPESVAVVGSNILFFDIYSKAFIANTPGGNVVLSDMGLRNHFIDLCNVLLTRTFSNLKVFSAVNQYGGVIVSILDATSGSTLPESLYFNPEEKKWKSFLLMNLEYMTGGYRLITFLSGELWCHYHPTGTYGLIHGVQVEQSIKLSTLGLPGEDKVFLALAINTTNNTRLTRTYSLTGALATGTITVSGTPVAGETFKIGTQTFTFRATWAAAGDVVISANNTTQAENIVAAITRDVSFVNAVNVAGVVTVTAVVYGTAGNSIDLEETATGVAVSAAHLAGASDTADSLVLRKMWSAEYNGDVCIPPTDVNPVGMKTRIKAARFERLAGELVVDIPRDIMDSSYSTLAERVVNGRKLSGKQLDVTIRNQADTSVSLESVSITYVKDR